MKKVGRWNKDLEGLLVSVTDLKPDPENTRLHDDRNLSSIRKSLLLFGQQRCIVATKDGTVIAGNGTLEAALLEGWTHLAVTRFDNQDRMMAKAYGVVDNRASDLSFFDEDLLVDQLDELAAMPEIELDDLGFSEADLDILKGESMGDGSGGKGLSRKINVKITCPKCGEEIETS